MTALASVFRDKLIPWSQDELDHRLVVAQPVMSKAALPYGVDLTRKKIPGKRELVRTRDDGPQKAVLARWPEAEMHEIYAPKLVCVIKGHTDFRAGNYVISCNEGHFILLPPFLPNLWGGRSHLEGENRRHGSCELLQLILYRDRLGCSNSLSRGEQIFDRGKCAFDAPHILQLFRLFIEEAQQAGMLCAPLLTSTLTFLLREINSGHYEESRLDPLNRNPQNSTIEQTRTYIKTHLRQSLTIEQVAQAMYMSPSQFTRFIRKETGHSFAEILCEYRIAEAKVLLRDSSWTVAAISRQIGLKSTSYFISLFIKHVGCSPDQYRRSKTDRISQ